MARISLLVLLCCLFAAPLFANKSSVKIDAPDKAVKGTVATIKLTISHKGNNLFHHTEWVYVKIDGKEIARWEYSFTNLPEDSVFVKEVEYTVNDTITIEAEASCNIHGSAGISEKKIEAE